MTASKTLTAAIAAATIIGTVGYVSAQTADPAATPTPTQEMRQPAPADTTAPAAMDTTPAPAESSTPSSSKDMSTPSTTSDVNAAPAEPAPKADRN